MRKLLAFTVGMFLSLPAFGDAIDPTTTQMPWVNGPTRDAVYKLWDAPNKVFVWEAFSISCPWCHRNAPQVEELAQFYRDGAEENPAYERVQFADLCLNSSTRDCREWIDEHEPTYPVLKDVDRYVWRNLSQSNSIPQTFVTDCNGNLVAYTIGYWDASSIRTIKRGVEEALEVECEVPDQPDEPDQN